MPNFKQTWTLHCITQQKIYSADNLSFNNLQSIYSVLSAITQGTWKSNENRKR